MSTKSTYILLHGAWHASWCWQPYVVPALLASGVNVIAPNLPGHGVDDASFADIKLSSYVNFVMNLVDSCSEPVVLVGHSLSGMIISQVAENMPQKIAQLIYLCAFLPRDGESLLQIARTFQSPGLGQEIHMNAEKTVMSLQSSPRLKELFYNHCSDSDVSYALEHLQPEPARPSLDTVHLSADNFGRVPKRYVSCRDDRVIAVENQEKMCAGVISDVICLEADHSPFFSAPMELVKALLHKSHVAP